MRPRLVGWCGIIVHICHGNIRTKFWVETEQEVTDTNSCKEFCRWGRLDSVLQMRLRSEWMELWGELWVSDGVWCLISMHPRHIPLEGSRHIQLVRGPVVDPEHAGAIIYLIFPWNPVENLRRSWRELLGWSTSGFPNSISSHCSLVLSKWNQMDG